MVDEIHNVISTLFQRRKSYVNPSSDFVKRSHIHNRHARNCDSLEIPAVKTSVQRTFSYMAVKTWSNLDHELKQITVLDKFKKKLKQQLINSSIIICNIMS